MTARHAPKTDPASHRLRHLLHCLALFFLANTALATPVAANASEFESNDVLKALIDEQPVFLKVDEAFVLTTDFLSDGVLTARWQMPPGYYLYGHRFGASAVEPSSVTLGEPAMPPGKDKYDEYEEAVVEVYYDSAEMTVPVSGSGVVELRLAYQGCADAGLCYPPESKPVWIDLDRGEIVAAPLADSVAESGSSAEVAATRSSISATAVTEEQALAGRLAESSTLAALALFLIGGIALAFTPCVLPMVPILSSIIVGESENLSKARAFTLSLAYVLGMAVTYAAIGTLVGLFGAELNIQAQLQSPPVLIFFALTFAVLSLSMFGFYELQLPSGVQNRLNTLSSSVGGGKHLSVAIMGSLSSLVVSPCVSAPLAGALIYISSTGDAVLGGLALFTLAIGMGLPLLLLGASGGHLLPRAGVWMDNVKAVFGVLLLGVAVWLLERVVPASVTLALWATLAIGSAVYLGALDFSPRSGWGQLWKSSGVVLLVYGVLLLIGAASGASDPLRPLGQMSVASSSGGGAAHSEANWLAVSNTADVDARLGGEPAILDLYADWCISCKVMERNVFPAPEVASQLATYRLLRADVTDNNDEHQALLNRYGLFGPPSLLFFDAQGRELVDLRIQGEMNREQFAAHLTLVRTRLTTQQTASR
ncbi:MAG: protein-disulfide reductase DsbD [Pseudomonadaceae bacterium]|nr:protein-disulfide reductase DsbD [Pseudomonadaceae bacterium]